MMSLVLESPLDMHLHLREGDMLDRVAPLSAAHFAGAVIMPNLVPPVVALFILGMFWRRASSSSKPSEWWPVRNRTA